MPAVAGFGQRSVAVSVAAAPLGTKEGFVLVVDAVAVVDGDAAAADEGDDVGGVQRETRKRILP